MIQPLTESTDAKVWLDRYRDYLERVLGLAPATRHKYLFVVGKLLGAISPDGTVRPSMFTADAVSEFVRNDAAGRTGRGVRQSVSPVRSFLRFLVFQGILSPGLESVVPKLRRCTQTVLPQPLSDREVDGLLEKSVDDTGRGARNHAVLLLLSRLGLRSHELTSLQLSDLDWASGSILIRGRKTRAERVLPLPQDVGEALLNYLRKGRAETDHREVFVQQRAPFGPVRPDAISKLVARLLAQAGVRRHTACGAHLFRHTAATRLVNRGVPFKDIADLLGHQSLQTTAIYAKLNLVSLSQIALPWTGGDQ